MYFKTLIIALALPLLLKVHSANFINDDQESRKLTMRDQPEEDENPKDDAKRALGSKKKQSIAALSLELAKLHILEEILKKSKANSLNDEVNENSQDKCTKIKKVGDPIVHHHSGNTQGAWMRDPSGLLGAEKIWYINGYYGNKVLEFDSMDHFKAGEITKTYTLPYYIDGTGWTISLL